MNNKIYVLFPPEGREKIEFDFILHQESDRFVHHFRKVIEPPYTGSDDEIIKRIQEEVPGLFSELRAVVSSGQWVGIKNENGKTQDYRVGFPKVNFEKYLCAIRYANYLSQES